MSDSIKVAIKVRPLIRREKDDNSTIQWVVQENSIVSTDPEMKKRGDGGFYFDHIFDMNASNSNVFNTIVKPIVDAAVNGFNGTVFAYGQTSSGKTYTMMGTLEEPGIIPLAVEYMFDAIANTVRREFLLRVSYLEIYNERVNDLLNKSNTDLKLKEDGSGQVILQCKEEITNCPENVLSIMKKGDKNRRVGETNMNERSSRSHTIFRITIESREAGGNSDGAIQVSQLNLVDLAGSERARQTGATGERFKEGRHINLSLSTLGLVIMQLSESQDAQKHVNFRDSKLTRLLQNSLGGNAMTAIICAVTPAALEETQCTLSFASRAKSVKNKPQINEVMSDAALLKRYAKQLAKLQAELEKMKTKNRSAEVEEMETKLQEKDRINQLLEERIELLKTRIVSGDTTDEETFKCKSKRRQTWGGPGVFNQHLPVFQPTVSLPTIRETSFERPHRKSIIQSVNLMNQTFQTAFTDFELELFESERDRVNEETGSESEEEPFVTKRNKHRVTFRDDVFTIKSKNNTSSEENSLHATPEKCNTSTQTTSIQASPSTPKHILRQHISNLTNEYEELLEYTTLEKQLLCHEYHCCTHEGEVQKKVEYNTEVKERLERLNLAGESNTERIITELCAKLNEAEEKTRLEVDSNKKMTKQFAELQTQIRNITSEKDEFEYISRELRAQLKTKTAELEWKNMSEENIKEPERNRIAELEQQMESVVSEKEKLERVNGELRTESAKKVTEMLKQIEYVTSERDEFQHMRHELRVELNKKSLELEKLKNDPETIRGEMATNIKELEKRIEDITSDKNKLEHVNGELNEKVLELESTITSKQAAHQEATEQISRLQGEIESVTIERNEFERVNTELNCAVSELKLKITSQESEAQKVSEKISELESQIESMTSERTELQRINTELSQKTSELESKVVVEQTASESAMEKVCKLEKQIEGITSERNEIECLSAELNQKIAELESQIISERAVSQNGMERISQLEVQIESMTSEKNELQRINTELNQKTSELESKIVVEQTARESATEKVCELEKQIEGITSEKTEFERLTGELNQKIAELESQIVSEQAVSQNGMERISQLEVQIESMTSEKNELQRINTELNQKTSELESKIVVEQTARESATEKVCELEKQIEGITSEKTEFERLTGELNQKIAELESQIVSERAVTQNGMERISQLEVQIESITSEKNELQHINTGLNQKTSELESKIVVEQTASQNAIERISQMEVQIESITSEKNEFERLSGELDQKISELQSQAVSEQTASQSAMEKISELNKEKNELQRVNSRLRDELDKKPAEPEQGNDRDYINENNNLKVYIKDLQNMITTIQTENQDLKDQMRNQSLLSCSRFNESSADVSSLMINIEAEKSQLEETLHLKSLELDEIKGDVRGLKMDIENLQKTIYLLTTENMDMATKLTTEQENAKQAELHLQKTIDELYTRISEVTNAKINLEGDLTSLKDELESMRSRAPETHSEEQLFATYQSKIDKLTAENIELSASIAEKNKELENIKESKSLLYDHECIYREKVIVLTQKNESLVLENNELSSDLIDKIEDNDLLKEQCDILKSKIEQTLAMKDNAAGNNVEHLESENNVLKAEIAELKRKVAILCNENVTFSNNLLETMENLDCSRNEGSRSNTLHLSTIFNETGREIVQEESREVLVNNVKTLQDKIGHLTRLNKKLSDLKLTSCSQCAHLKNLNESRRALKLEAKSLNYKLEDLQRKFEQKCADTEILKNKIYQELNLSAQNGSPNVSFVDEMNVSFVEERIQDLNEELQALRVDHDKLSVMYEDKCNEHGQLQNDLIMDGRSLSEDSTPKKSRRRNRIEQIQKHIDCLRGDIDKLNGNSVNFNAILDQFKFDKANLLDEIKVLKATNEELQQKVSDESTAAEKVRILETELTNMSKEIEQFSVREKEFESQRLILEVALEDLKAEEQSKNSLINQLNQHISSLKSELDLVVSQKNELALSHTMEDKYIEQLELLKKQCEELETEKVQSMEVEQHAALRIKELEAYIENLQQNITQQEHQCKDLREKGFHLEKLLHESEQEKYILTQKVQAVESELIEFKTNLEIGYKNEFDSMSLQYEHRVKESENNLQKLTDTLNKYVDENLNMTQELTRLQNIEEKFNAMRNENERVFSAEKTLISDNEKLSEELNSVRKCMTKELRSLRCDINTADLSNKPINEIFVIFLQTLVSKEKEVMRTMRETFEKDKQKLEDEKQQSADTEKRATIWAKELEAEIEKLQTDLTEQEHAQKEYQNKIAQLEHLLTESNHEKEILKEKMQGLETDLNNLQTEFDKQCKVDTQQEEAIVVAQKREKEAQETFKNKEIELQSKLKSAKETYEKTINDLTYTIESYKTKNLELNSTIEGLEVNEKQLKNIVEANSAEMRKNNHNIEKLNAELEQLTEAYNELNQEMEQKASHIEEITAILKNKCDLLSEYKTKLEIVMPEYETLKDHVRDQKTAIERYKEEIETLKKERETQLEIIQEKLNSKEIQNAGLTKQLNELNNKNIALIEELNELKGKYEELQQANAKLENKIRNSTSKIQAEAEIEELKELNKRLQNNLEGASNRVAELQEIKNKTLKELVDLQSKHELISQENNEMKKTLSSYKSKYSTSSLLLDEGKYDALLLEKNKIALELEDKKLMLNQKDKELQEYATKVQQLTEKNKEFDVELDEYAAIIQEQNIEISKLEGKLDSRLTENTIINELEEKLKSCREENEKLRDHVDALKTRLQMNVEQTEDNRSQTEMVIHMLKKENQQLQAKLNDCKKQLELTINTNSDGLRETSMNQSRNSNKKVQNSVESECNRITELQGEKNKIINKLFNLKRQYDLLCQENMELKRTLMVYEPKRSTSNLLKDGDKLDDVLKEKNNLAQELEAQKSLLNQKDKELKEYINKIRDLTARNKELDTELEKLRFFSEENRKLRNDITELRLRLNTHSERIPLREESTGKQLRSIVFDKELSEYKEKCQQLKKRIHELELQLVSKNGKIATLDIQIQSENFPYQRKCKELEELLLAFRSKNAELSSEVRKLQRTVNDVNAWECDICRRWRVNRNDQACQTIPNDTLRLCSTNSGIVGDHVKIQKLEKEKMLMRELCRSRSRQIKELQEKVKELEEAQSSATSRPAEVLT